MRITALSLFKVCEFSHGIVIMGAADAMKQSHHTVDMITADIATCCEYLARYTDARKAGKTIPDAHEEALRGARIVDKGNLGLTEEMERMIRNPPSPMMPLPVRKKQ